VCPTVASLTPRARCSSIYMSSSSSRLLIAFLLNAQNGEPTLAVLNVIETNSMTSDMTLSEVAMSPELN
jgi:hypothetical protein